MAIGRGTCVALAIEAQTIGSYATVPVELATRTRTATINIGFRPVGLGIEALRVTAFVLRARDIANTIARLIAVLAFVAHRALRSTTIDIRFSVVELGIRTRADVAKPVDARGTRCTIGVQ